MANVVKYRATVSYNDENRDELAVMDKMILNHLKNAI
jgi:hypothetical protein